MKPNAFWFGALSLLLAASSARPQAPATPTDWPAITSQARPWTYNWWMGSAVDEINLARLLKTYREAGLGGIHIVPIYGAKGAESRHIPYLTPRWMEILAFTVDEAHRNGLGIDMTTGTGWCFGGPQVPKPHGCMSISINMATIPGGQPHAGKLDRLNVQAAMAFTEDGKKIDLLASTDASGRYSLTPDKPRMIVTLTLRPTNMQVKRSAAGGAGLMLNPLLPEAMQNYLQFFSEIFGKYRGRLPRSMYHDSFEYNTRWSTMLLSEFEKRRGYRLQDRLNLLTNTPGPESLRVRADFLQTVDEVLVEQTMPQWTKWCKERGILTRNQAHGSPGNLLDLYALADIPETEMFGRGTRNPLVSRFDEQFFQGDREPLISKFASSAAHVTGKQLVSAETGTWLAEHFCETLEELKCLVDLLFASGVNHVFYHGTCYSPADAPWPGWLFYASTQMNERNAIWRDAPALNAYIARCQSILQSGRPDNDVLLYWPIRDLWATPPEGRGDMLSLVNCTVHNHKWLTNQPIHEAASMLWKRGYGFDYVSDRQLAGAQVKEGMIVMPGGTYRALMMPPAKHLPETTAKKLKELEAAGAKIVRTESELDRIVAREGVVDQTGVLMIRRKHDAGRHYFITNLSPILLDKTVKLATPARSVIAMDPMTGRTGLLRIESGAVRLHLEPGHSIILRTFEDRAVEAPPWRWLAMSEPKDFQGKWSVRFIAGGPELPKPYETDKLESWTHRDDGELQRFGGSALYRTVVDAPGAGPWMLDLGQVCHSAKVRVNGRDIGTLIMPPYRVVMEQLRPTGNELEIEVTNLSANRIRDLDQRKVVWRTFNDINLVNIGYKPFDASNWPVMDSGLIGPVRLGEAREK